ncbi:MAG: AmmeMemoRadiSam system radical SAM enzyme [bacterium]
MFYTKKSDNIVKCELCPVGCSIPEGQRGVCRARKNINGELYSLVYEKPVAMNIDPIEKKPLLHFHPESKIFSIATAGCNLRCTFCQNWQISHADPLKTDTRKISPEAIVELAEKYGSKSIAYTYTEPTVYYEYMFDIARLAKKKEMKNVLISCGNINEKPLKKLIPYLDAANIDLKGFSDSFYKEHTTGTKEPVLRSLKILEEAGVHLEITNLVIPGSNDDMKTIKKMCLWIKKELGENTVLHFSRFSPAHKLMNKPPTPEKTLRKAREIALKAGLKYVYIGNIRTEAEDTYCPKCGKKIIDRSGYQIKSIKMKNGKCGFCGETIDGVW